MIIARLICAKRAVRPLQLFFHGSPFGADLSNCYAPERSLVRTHRLYLAALFRSQKFMRHLIVLSATPSHRFSSLASSRTTSFPRLRRRARGCLLRLHAAHHAVNRAEFEMRTSTASCTLSVNLVHKRTHPAVKQTRVRREIVPSAPGTTPSRVAGHFSEKSFWRSPLIS